LWAGTLDEGAVTDRAERPDQGVDVVVDPDLTASDDGRSARASMVVAGCTALSRVSGVLRVLLVGAVLGPTHLGDAYQVTNTLPNLVWYGFLAGSLVPALLVPVLVNQIRALSAGQVERTSRGFLGVAVVAGLVIAPLAVLGLPLLMKLATLGIPASLSDEQVRLARLLVLLTAPQTFLYALIGTAGAVMYAHRRFALPSIGPTLENVGVIVVLVAVALGYGSRQDISQGAPVGELVLLGAGSTGAVALNAGLQWWGAKRLGVRLLPGGGWRDPTVRLLLRRATHSVVAAALLAAQTLLILLLASRVTGGAVALQVALNFYVLPVALIATPIGLAILPELSGLVHASGAIFDETLGKGLASAIFLAAPAAAGYLLMAGPVARVVSAGRMSTPTGHAMVAGSLAALSVGLLGQTVCFISTQASYARGDSRTPLVWMAVQSALCLLLCGVAVLVCDGPVLVTAVGVAYAAATLAGGLLLLAVISKLGGNGLLTRLMTPLLRVAMGIAVMAVPVRLLVTALTTAVPGRTGDLLALGVGSLTGIALYVGTERLLRSPELEWWLSGLRRRPAAQPAPEEVAA
jgi:putative peptidoglycan lipid II flippase